MPEQIADFSHILRVCAFAAQSKGASDILLKCGLLRDIVRFFLRTQKQVQSYTLTTTKVFT